MKSASLYSAVAAVVVVSIAHGTVCHLDKADPFIGTGGNGHTTPAAAYPFGMVQPGPDTGHEGWERCSAYQYGDGAVQRFSQNHLSGTGCSEFGDLGFMPSAEDPDVALDRDYHAEFEKKDEKASPGYYAVTLDCGTKVEATCTKHVSLFRFTFPKDKPASLLFDPSWSFDKTKSVQVSPMKKRRVSGHVDRSYSFEVTKIDVGDTSVTVAVTLTRTGKVDQRINGTVKFYGAETLAAFKSGTATPLVSKTLVDDDFSDGETTTATFDKDGNVFFDAKIEE